MSWTSWAMSWMCSFVYPSAYGSWTTLVIGYGCVAVLVQQTLRAMWLAMAAPRIDYHGKHVLVTGGSEGLGLEMARWAVGAGASVTIIARKQEKLDAAVAQLSEDVADPSTQFVQSISADVSDAEAIAEAVLCADDRQPVFTVIANAGVATTGYHLDLSYKDFERTCAINYLGAVATVQPLLPRMVQRREGQIALVASAAGLVGMLGFAAYTPTKWALRGYADCLRQETLPFGVSVSVLYPADVETPGYAIENETKPVETLEMSESGGLISAHQAAVNLMSRLAYQEYHIGTDIGVDLLRIPMTSTAPRSNVVLEIILMPIVGIITGAIGWWWDSIVYKHSADRPDVAKIDLPQAQ